MKVITITSNILAPKVAKRLKCEFLRMSLGSYPDKEMSLKYEGDLQEEVKGQEVLIVQSTYPNQEYLFDAVAALPKLLRDNGAKRVIAFVPFLNYLRQSETDVSKNEAPLAATKLLEFNGKDSSGKLYLDSLHVVNPHSISPFSKCLPKTSFLDDTELIAREIKKLNLSNATVIAPDEGAINAAKKLANFLGVSYGHFDKKRLSGTEVKLETGDIPKADTYIIRDDMISTGGTLAMVVRYLAKTFGAKNFIAACSHPLMVGGAAEMLKKSGITKIIGTNSIENEYGIVDLSPLVESLF